MSETIQAPNQTVEPAQSGTNRWKTILMWLGVLGFVSILGWGLLNSTAPRPEVGQPAPPFKMEYFSGYEWENQSTATLDDMKGNIVVVNFWASWCIPCRTEAPAFEQMWQKYQDQEVVFVGITYADVESNALAHMQEFNLTYPHAPDLGTAISADYEISAVPETFIVDKEGNIARVIIGPIDAAALDNLIGQMVSQ